MKNGLSNVVAIATGPNYSLALKSSGTVFGWGYNAEGQATGVASANLADKYSSSGLVAIRGQVLTNVTAIAAGKQFCLALKKDGTVVGWGNNNFHKMDVPVGLSNVVAISVGEDFCLAITTNGTVAERFRQK